MRNKFDSKSRFQMRFLVFTIVLVVWPLGTIPINAQNLDQKIIIVADVSNSMRGNGIEIVRAALGNIAYSDEITRATTLILYPSRNVFEARNFKNSTEIASSIEQIKIIKGKSDVREIFKAISVGLRDQTKSNSYNVLWLTDGGFLKNFFSREDSLSILSEITLLKSWTIVDVSEQQNVLSLIPAGVEIQYESMRTPNADFFRNYFKPIRESIAEERKDGTVDFRPSNFALLFSTIIALFSSFLIWKLILWSMRRFQMSFQLSRRRELLSSQLKDIRSHSRTSERYFVPWKLLPNFLKNSTRLFALELSAKSTEKRMFTFWALGATLGFVGSYLMTRNLVLSIIIGIASPTLFFNYLLSSRRKKALKEFGEELPGLLMLMSSGLKSGLTLEQNLEAYCQQNDNAVAREFRRVVTEVRMGNDISAALRDLSLRMNSEDLEWLVTAILIQKDVGGSLSVIVDTVLDTISGRREISREVRSLSAEGKLSAYVLIALPILLFVFLSLTQRDYVANLWSTQLGWLLLSSIFVLITTGWFWMSKVVKIKV